MNLLGYREPNLVHLARCKVTISTMHFFYVLWNFFPFYGKYFLSSAMDNLVSSTIENIFICMDKFSISSRLVIWNLDPRANVVRQEVQYCALRRR